MRLFRQAYLTLTNNKDRFLLMGTVIVHSEETQ